MYECYVALPQSGNEVEILINDAKRWYFFRMACGHLHEALVAFQDLLKAKVDKIIERTEPEGLKAYQQLQKATRDPQSDFNKIIKPIRNKAAFHYNVKSRGFQEALRDLGPEAEGRLILAETRKDARFLIADDIMNNLVSLALERESAQKLSIEEIGAYAKEIGRIQGSLLTFIDHFFKAYLEYYDLVDKFKK